jgi:hypothetical protein
MKSRMILIALFSVVAVTGCVFGKSAAKLPVATSPRGVVASLLLPTGRISGELIEIGDEGMVVQENTRRILFIPYRVIRSFVPKDLPDAYRLRLGERPAGDKRSRLQSVSHFPQGMTPDIKRKVLEAAGQSDFILVQ